MDQKRHLLQPSEDCAIAVPQLRLRTDLRGGESVDSCMKNLNEWQQNYYKWYNQVNVSKPTPCNGYKA